MKTKVATRPDGRVWLLTREESSMSSAWDVHLYLEFLPDDSVKLLTCRHEILGSIYDLVPEEKLYDADGEIKVPKKVNGKVIVGLADGEYLEVEDLYVESESSPFTSMNADAMQSYCVNEKWDRVQGFDGAIVKVDTYLKSSNAR